MIRILSVIRHPRAKEDLESEIVGPNQYIIREFFTVFIGSEIGGERLKKFVVILKDRKKGHLTNDLLQQHVDHLRALHENGKLYLCGPFADSGSAMQILLTTSLANGHELVQKDPFVQSGYYGSYDLFELIEANDSNNWLLDASQTKETNAV